jgi:trehalose 6-phosphate synthase
LTSIPQLTLRVRRCVDAGHCGEAAIGVYFKWGAGGDCDGPAPPGEGLMSRLIVVSNRVPNLAPGKEGAGGLAVGLQAALRKQGGIWFGWSGRTGDGAHNERSVAQEQPFALVTVDLSRREHEDYYLGFANRLLWPALHGRTGLIRFRRAEYATYAGVNARLARHLRELVKPDDVVWVHDYHLLLLGRELRALGVTAPLGFFLHTPFPSADAMSVIPSHRDLVGALASFDLVGFQTRNDLANFHEYAIRHLDGKVHAGAVVHALGRKFHTGAFPIGIDVAQLRRLAGAKLDALGRLFDPGLRGMTGVIGVDRLDYTKGLEQRLDAFELLLRNRPDLSRRTFMLQIAAPSREAIGDYKDLRTRLQALAGKINSRYGEIDWTPVHYINRTYAQSRLALLYRHCRVGFVTPLRDGMNLVAKEYVAAQNPHDPGVLVLSCFAGAAERLQSALIVNPFDVETVAETLARAIEMPMDERRERWDAAMAEVERHDIHHWCRSFLTALARARTRGGPVEDEDLPARSEAPVKSAGRAR